jgi:hypothetical protein
MAVDGACGGSYHDDVTRVALSPFAGGDMPMRTFVTRAALIAAILFLTGACASSDDWSMWRSHSTHFASGEHGFFSMRNNKDGSNPKVYRSDIEASRQENWWGLYAITVSPSQIFQN